MRQKYDADMSTMLEEFVFSNLPDCQDLRKNTQYLLDEYILQNNNGLDSKRLIEELFSNVDLYQARLPQILRLAGLFESYPEANNKIQMFGAAYIMAIVAKSYGISLKGIRKRLNKIEKAIVNLLKLIELDSELAAIGVSIFATEGYEALKADHSGKQNTDFTNSAIIKRHERLTSELKALSSLGEEFSESILAKWMQYGASGPKEGSALNVFLSLLAEVWVLNFGRTLTFSSNPLSGREAFLNFAESCLNAIHPGTLKSRPDKLRNAYEKLRVKGSFDYLTQNPAKLV